MKSRSRSRLEMEVFGTGTGADGEEYQVGCCCDDHSDDTNWIQCTERNRDIWYCEDDIRARTGASDADLNELRDSPSLFKCMVHGLEVLEFKADEEPDDKIVSGYNFRKRIKKPSLKEVDATSNDVEDNDAVTNSFGRKFPKETKAKKPKSRNNKRKNNASKKNTIRCMMCLFFL